jgi:hypothetical protein
MSYVVVMWIVWAALGLVLLGLILYRISLTQDEEDRLFLEDGADETQHHQQDEMLAKLKRLTPVIRIFGGAEGLVTLGIVAFYVMDALRQF